VETAAKNYGKNDGLQSEKKSRKIIKIAAESKYQCYTGCTKTVSVTVHLVM